MADDFLAAVTGALEGFERAYLPYQQAKLQDNLLRRRQQEDDTRALAQAKAVKDYELSLKEPEITYFVDSEGKQLAEPIVGKKGQNVNVTKIESGRSVYKKSELLAMTPEERSKVPKNITVVDDSIDERSEDRRNERLDRMRGDLISKFNSDPNVRKYKTMSETAITIKELANSGNPIAAAAIPTYMARASGEVGNLSEADKRPFGGSQAILERLEAAFKQAATGQLSEDNKKFINELSDLMDRRSRESLKREAKRRSKQYGKLKSYGTEDDIYQLLSPDLDEDTLTPEEAAELEALEKEGYGD